MKLAQKSWAKVVRRQLEETLQAYAPGLGWSTLYSRVAFSCERFSEIQRKNDRQTTVLRWLFNTSVLVATSSVFFTLPLSLTLAGCRSSLAFPSSM